MKVLIYLRRRAGKSLVIFLLPMMLASCSGSTNATGPAPPLPTGQNGSLALWKVNNAGCYVPDGTGTCPAGPSNTNSITALTTLTVSPSTFYLLVGDNQGNVYAWTASSSPSSPPVTCSFSFSAGTSVNGLASVVNSSGTTDVYAVAGQDLKVISGTPPCPTSGTLSNISSTLSGTYVGLAAANGFVYGINSAGQYFSVDTTTGVYQSPTTLPNLPPTATIGGMTADQHGIVFMTDYANSAIYAYYANSNGTLTRINGTLSGNVDVTNPKAITTVTAPNPPTSTGCTTGSCEFLYVTNYSQAVVQFVLSINGSGTSTSIGYTEFNAPYTSCEIINPVAMTSFPNVVNPAISSTIPYVYIGENGSTTSSSCFGETSFGNNVTGYTLSGE